MKLFYTKHHNDYLHFIKAEDAATARVAYLAGYSDAGYSDAARAGYEADVLVEVDCLETLIDLLPVEFEACEEF